MDRDPTGSSDPAFAKAQSQDDTGDGFHFLPPLANNPAVVGTFNPHLLGILEVEICRLTPDPACAGEPQPPADLQTDDLVLDLAGELYATSWKASAVVGDYNVAVYYRLPGATERGLLGSKDFVVVNSASELQGEPSVRRVGVVSGANFPIKFRVDTGFSEECDDPGNDQLIYCFEALITDAGAIVTNDDGTSGIQIEPGSLPDGDVRFLVFKRIAADPCMWTGFQHPGGVCFEIEWSPPLTEPLVNPAIVAFCPEYHDPEHKRFLRMYRAPAPGYDEIHELKPAVATWLSDCDPDDDPGHTSLLGRAYDRFAASVSRVFGVRPAYAKFHFPLASETDLFSHFAFLRPVTMTEHSLTATGASSYTATVQVLSAVPALDEGVTVFAEADDIEVTFAVTAGGGSITGPATLLTDAHGLAAVSWSITPGVRNELTATTGGRELTDARGLGPQIVVFEVIPYTAYFLPPVGTSSNLTTLVTDDPPVLRVCRTAAPSVCIADQPATLGGGQYQVHWRPPPSDRQVSHTLTVLVDGHPAGGSATYTPGRNESNIPVKFGLLLAN